MLAVLKSRPIQGPPVVHHLNVVTGKLSQSQIVGRIMQVLSACIIFAQTHLMADALRMTLLSLFPDDWDPNRSAHWFHDIRPATSSMVSEHVMRYLDYLSSLILRIVLPPAAGALG